MKPKKTEWSRNCPECNNILYYGYKHTWKNAKEKNSVCNSCKQLGSKNPFYGKTHTKEHKEYLSNLHMEGTYDEAGKKISEKLKGRIISQRQREKLSSSLIEYHKNNKNPMTGKTHTKEARKLISDASKKQWKQYRKTDEYKEWKASKSEYELYYSEVIQITHNNDLSVLKNYSKKNLYHGYELDHIFPISKGFKLNVPAELIGHIDNLRIIPMEQNRSKKDKLIEDIIPDMLIEYVENYE